jgi:hypothetical protein
MVDWLVGDVQFDVYPTFKYEPGPSYILTYVYYI